ncbi:uncharacterized protein LOC123466814 [Daphnia magna]|uniref:uncharacterized protein LOC123466814 n=1 Tax=Daphnia magna TaxID=35525 RepID=UPI001E1BA8C5|nr:uncharacterized protein LOC123466814 [Daphnia magna]
MAAIIGIRVASSIIVAFKAFDFNRDYSANWHYCPITSNPADLVTRGVTFHQLQASPIWISGPSWLSDRSAWPQWEASGLNSNQVLHLSAIHPNPAPAPAPPIDISKFMDITRPLKTKELLNAEIQWIRSFQYRNFAAEIEYLRDMKGRRPPLVTQLDLYIDSDSPIRCRGRLLNADIPKTTRNPILLPKSSEITRLIISYYHERSLHSGVMKSIVRLYTRCRRVNGAPYRAPNPATLPSFRVRGDKAFAVTGIDFAGPFPVRGPPGQPDPKAYICLFTCTSSRAIYLELVENLTAANFILAFRSFISHHFTPTMVLSDNATTFECSARALKSLFNSSEVTKYLSDRQIEWRFIPKRAPWYGGFWERLVGLTKEALKKMLGRTKLKFNEFRTIVTEIEAILNDHPLTYVSSDLNDPQALTPSHLLYGGRLTPLPYDPAVEEELLDPTFGEKPSHLLAMFSRRQRILKAFWYRWQIEYLTSLRERHITSKNGFKPSIKVGDVVLVHNEGPRIDWKLAVIDSLITSPDEEIRAANIHTAKGKTNRPVSKLYPLEVTATIDSSPRTQIPPNSDTSLPTRPRRKVVIAAEKWIRDEAQE